MEIGFCFFFKKKNETLESPVPKIQTVVLAISGSNLLLIFHNNVTAEFWPTFSYRVLLQRFFWNFRSIFIISKADTRNCSTKYQRFSLNSGVLLSANLPPKYLPSMKSEYCISLPNDFCCSFESFAAIALKTKKVLTESQS